MLSVKLIVVGDGAVGKTCTLIAYTTNSFPQEYIPTVFDDYAANVMVDGVVVNLGLWDTAGQETYDKLRPQSYPGTDVFLVCFAVNQRVSFDRVKTAWVPELTKYAAGVPYILLATKTDLRTDTETLTKLAERSQKPVSPEEGAEMAKSVGAEGYFECSALQQTGLKEVFEAAMRAVIARHRVAQPASKKGACILS